MKSTPLFRLLPLIVLIPGLVRAADVDWTPRLTTVDAEGMTLTRLYFAAGKQKFGISLDFESQPEVAGTGTKVTFKKVPSAVFFIRPSPNKVALPVPTDRLADYQRAAIAFAPAGATDFSELEDTLEPLNINQWKSYRLTFSYNYFGRRIRHAVTFLTLENGQQAVLDTSAIAKEFTEALVRSDHLIRTWHELPDEESGAARNSGT